MQEGLSKLGFLGWRKRWKGQMMFWNPEFNMESWRDVDQRKSMQIRGRSSETFRVHPSRRGVYDIIRKWTSKKESLSRPQNLQNVPFRASREGFALLTLEEDLTCPKRCLLWMESQPWHFQTWVPKRLK